MIGLPDSVRACLFDLDSVLTRVAELHAAAWEGMFDGYLSERAVRTEEHFHSFGAVAEYANGKPRHDGVQSFLTARSIGLPEGWHRGVLRGPHRRGGSLVAEREGLTGKPAPDTFPAAARALGVAPGQAAVFEDALGGVAAGRAGASTVLSALTASGRPRRCASTARALWCPLFASCWRTDDPAP